MKPESKDKNLYNFNKDHDYPANNINPNLIDIDGALTGKTEVTQDHSVLGMPQFKKNLYKKDKDNSFQLDMSAFNNNSMISQIGDMSMIHGRNDRSQNRSQILQAACT